MNQLTESLRRHPLAVGIFLMFLLTWPIDLANSGVLPFRVPFAVALLVGYGSGVWDGSGILCRSYSSLAYISSRYS